jgi:hypothetical protein
MIAPPKTIATRSADKRIMDTLTAALSVGSAV